MALIRRLTDERPTYGYRRITSLLNRQQKADGKPKIIAKRVLRIMQANKLTLERRTGRRPGRTHDGVVIALRSNVRWCSDHFELACRDGEIVRVLFAIDACDREINAWSATTAGISGEMVRDLMNACVERRFGASRLRQFFYPCNAERLLEDLDFHGLAAEQPFQFTNPSFQPEDPACADNIFIGLDRLQPAFEHSPAPN